MPSPSAASALILVSALVVVPAMVVLAVGHAGPLVSMVVILLALVTAGIACVAARSLKSGRM